MDIKKELSNLYEPDFAAFQRRLIPNVDPERIHGVRTPYVRALAKKLVKDPDCEAFLCDLPHGSFEEDQLHVFVINATRPFDLCLERLERFLPYVDNWATSDQISPNVFKKEPERLLPSVEKWLSSDHTYKVRYGVSVYMQYFCDERFRPEQPERVAKIRSDEYYVNMMIAWYFATLLTKRYDDALPFMKGTQLAEWTRLKSIQKALESYRVTPEQKEELRSLKKREKT